MSRRAAFHEAGHAVACIRLGIGLRGVLLYHGHAEKHGEVVTYLGDAPAEDKLAAIYAGPLAEARCAKRPHYTYLHDVLRSELLAGG